MKFLLISVLTLFLITVPAFAQSDKSQGNNGNSQKNEKQEQKAADNNSEKQNQGTSESNSKKTEKTATTSANRGKSLTPEDCDPNYPWKNHGEYLSCVAKQKLGGKVVSEAARSDIGKKTATSSATPSATLNPEASSSATPSATLTPEPTDLSEATDSADIINNITESLTNLQQSITTLTTQFQSLLELLNPFN